MSAIAFSVDEKNRGYIKALPVASEQTERLNFNALDAAIIGFFLLCLGGLICYLLVG